MFFLILIIVSVLVIYLKKTLKPGQDAVVIHDTTIVTRYKNDLKNDTIVKWYEKIIYKKSEPEKILVQKIDTVFIENVKDLDVMLQIKKTKDILNIKAVNQNGKILKELDYKNVGNDFIATSVKNNVVLKSKKFYLDGLILYAELNSKLKKIQNNCPDKKLGLSTGINYLDKFNLLVGIYFSASEKTLGTYFGFNYKILK
jgi:hypothetical protein